MKEHPPKQDLHPYVQYLLKQQKKEALPQQQATTPKEIYVRKQTQQLARAIR